MLGNARGDPDRPIGARRDDPVDLPGPGEALDTCLVLGRDHGPLSREREAGGKRVAVDGDHLQGASGRGLEQAELRRARP